MSSHNESKSPVAEGSSTPPIDVQMFNQDIAVQNRGAKTEVDTNPPYRAIKSYITDLVEFQTRLQARGHSQNELEQINKEFETYPKAQESLGVSQSRLGPSTPFQPPDSDSSTPNFKVSVGSPTEPKPQSTGLPSSNFDFALSARSLFPASRRSPSKPKTTNSGSSQALEDRPDPTDIHGLPVRLKRNRPPKSSGRTVSPTSDTNPSLTKPLGTNPFRAGFPGPAFESPASSHVPARDVLFSSAPSIGLPTRSGVSGARSSTLAPFGTTSSGARILDNPKFNLAFSGIPPGDALPSAGFVGSVRVLTAVENDETSKWSVHGNKRDTLAPKDLFKDCTLDEARGFITENPSILELLVCFRETPLLGGWELISLLPIEESDSGKVWIALKKE